MLAKDVIAAVRAVMGLVEAGVHQEGNAAQQGRDAASDKCTPHIGSITWLEVHDAHNCLFAAGAGEWRWIIVGIDA